MDDESLCKLFGTTLEEVQADSEKYKTEDLSGITFGEPIDGKPSFSDEQSHSLTVTN